MQVYEGGHITVTSEDVVVTDPDSRIQDLVFVIDSPPRYGEIKDIAPGMTQTVCKSVQTNGSVASPHNIRFIFIL